MEPLGWFIADRLEVLGDRTFLTSTDLFELGVALYDPIVLDPRRVPGMKLFSSAVKGCRSPRAILSDLSLGVPGQSFHVLLR